MNCDVKYVSLALAFFATLACSSGRQSASQDHKQSHKLDSLPVTIIKPEIESSDSIVFIDTSSAIRNMNFYFYSDFENKSTSELCGIAVKKDKQFQFQKLSHTDFKELLLAIDDYGNINYLDQDF